MTLRAFLVDDEPLARERLRSMLGSIGGVEIVGEAGDAFAALAAIDATRPDLVFLDVQMPGRSGLDLAAMLKAPRPAIVFCTAFDEYAIRAFEMHALDYLLKPVTRARLAQTVERVTEMLEENLGRRRDLERAAVVQTRMFPMACPAMDAIEVAGDSLPARDVGGDYYDFFLVAPDTIGIAIADVSGKGAAAALLMASLQGRMQSLVPRYGADVAGLMRELNREIWRMTESARFITLFYGLYDTTTRTLTYANAGHNPPILLRLHAAVGDRAALDATGMVLGAFEDSVIEQRTIALAAGDIIAAFTDGVTEARDQHDQDFGDDRVATLVSFLSDESARTICERLLASADAFTGGSLPDDDRTVVIAKIN